MAPCSGSIPSLDTDISDSSPFATLRSNFGITLACIFTNQEVMLTPGRLWLALNPDLFPSMRISHSAQALVILVPGLDFFVWFLILGQKTQSST